jgi:VCBS repeat-containing protein
MPTPSSLANERLDALVGIWHTQGEVLGEDGSTAVATIEGTDAYEWLGGFFVIHRVDVEIGDLHIEALEVIGPYDAAAGSFPTQAYTNQGEVETGTASVDANGVWTFAAGNAKANLHVADDRQSMRGEWVNTEDNGQTWRPWMRLRLTRMPATSDSSGPGLPPAVPGTDTLKWQP